MRAMAIAFLNGNLWFPEPENAEPDGLLAAGGDLSVERLILAYKNGIFPWYSRKPVLWFNPDPRMVLFLDKLHISKSLRKVVDSGKFRVTFNECFEAVIHACAATHRHKGTWITPDIIKSFIALHEAGMAVSVEVWEGADLVGGLYGVCINGVFCGESMFHLVADASKVAMVYLVRRLVECGYVLIDAQVYSEHMEKFGAGFISRGEYLKILKTEVSTRAI